MKNIPVSVHFVVSLFLWFREVSFVMSAGRVVGYYQGNRALTSAQASKLTHLILAFSIPDTQGNLSPLSATLKQAQQTGKSANPALKVMVAVGGATAAPSTFSSLTASSASRSAFIAKIVAFVQNNGLDGVDIDWEFPSSFSDKMNYVSFLAALNQALPAAVELSIASAASAYYLDPGFDLAGIAAVVDFINVMCYDYYGTWSASTGPNSALYSGGSADPNSQLNSDWTITYHLSKMNNPSKLNMGVPFYARYWTNVGAPLNGADGLWRQLGTYGTELAYRDLASASFTTTQYAYQQPAKTAYVFNGNSRYLTFDNVQSLSDKAAYVATKGLGGIMVWSIDQDDDQTSLLSAISKNGGGTGGGGGVVTATTTTTAMPPPSGGGGSVTASARTVDAWASGRTVQLVFTNSGAAAVCSVKYRVVLPSGTTISSSWGMVPVNGSPGQYTLPGYAHIGPGQSFGDPGMTLTGSGQPSVTILSSGTC